MSCPLCVIPEEEPLHYSDDLVYLVDTKLKKGHKIRVMAVVLRHTEEPTFEERMRCTLVLYDYMNMVQGKDNWVMVDGVYGSIPEHFHLVACDKHSTDQEELELMEKTPKVILPLYNNLLIGIPAYNEQDNISEVVHRARRHGDVLVYCDGCTDSTAHRARKAGAKYVVEESPNLGYGGALDQIFHYARHYDYDRLIILDGDGQHDPDQIPQFSYALNNADIVVGNRFIGQHDTPVHRQMVIRTINTLLGIGDSQCGFRAYSKKALNMIKLSDYGMGASLEVLHIARMNKLTIAETPCRILYKEATHSSPTLIHGRMLVETLFWSLIWGRPLTVLAIPSSILGLYGLYSLSKLMYIYQTLNTFAIGLAIVGIGSILMGLMLFLSAVIIVVGRRQLTEMKR